MRGARQKMCQDPRSLLRNSKSAGWQCNFPSNNFARHRGLLRARPYGNRRREDRRERRSSNHIVEEHERGNMNNISARKTLGESRAAERERRRRGGRKREKPRERGTLGRQRLRRRKKREGARVGTTPWLVGSFDVLPPRDGPLPPAIPLRAGPVPSRSRSFAGRYRRLAPPTISLPRGSALSLPSLVS